ncbi:MAG TPA: NTP transferase domain-containing protein [Terrimesophilobacter sp.]|nr:NTP transferase domain-containing protein [Terrimesophilobacter sp.]
MLIDAVVLAGGRSARLGSVAKATLTVGGRDLLELTVSAALSVSRRCVVVGPIDPAELDRVAPGGRATRDTALDDTALDDTVQVDTVLVDTVLVTREEPPFAGPAAALEAGVRELAAAGAPLGDAVLVLACDMPAIERQLPVLVAALDAAEEGVDGAITVDASGRRQPLACLYRSRALADALARFSPGELVGRSMRDLIERLDLLPVAELSSATDDVDTWEDAARLGATIPTREMKEGAR